MSENSRAYIKALFGFDAVVQRVGPDQWANPSPCPGWDATEVVNHNILVAASIAEMARGNAPVVRAPDTDGGWPAFHGEGYVFAPHVFAAPREEPGNDPTELWNHHRDLVVQALDRDGALQTRTRSPWGHGTVEEFLGFAFYDPLIHTWDLARAVGQDPHLDAALVERARATLANPGDGRDLRQPMSLAPAIAPPSDDPVSCLIAESGRDPAV